jgi:hypothetical protein
MKAQHISHSASIGSCPPPDSVRMAAERTTLCSSAPSCRWSQDQLVRWSSWASYNRLEKSIWERPEAAAECLKNTDCSKTWDAFDPWLVQAKSSTSRTSSQTRFFGNGSKLFDCFRIKVSMQIGCVRSYFSASGCQFVSVLRSVPLSAPAWTWGLLPDEGMPWFAFIIFYGIRGCSMMLLGIPKECPKTCHTFS